MAYLGDRSKSKCLLTAVNFYDTFKSRDYCRSRGITPHRSNGMAKISSNLD